MPGVELETSDKLKNENNFVSEGFQNSAWPCVHPAAIVCSNPFKPLSPLTSQFPTSLSHQRLMDNYDQMQVTALRIFSQSP